MNKRIIYTDWYHFIVLARYVYASICSILKEFGLVQALSEFDGLFVFPMCPKAKFYDAIEELKASKQCFSRLVSFIALLYDVGSQFSSYWILDRDWRDKVYW